LLATALTNLLTKRLATIGGLFFTGAFFLVFLVSERINKRKFARSEEQMKEHFQLLHRDSVERIHLDVRPGNILVPVRDYNTLTHLKWALERVDTTEQDVVVMEARLVGMGSAEFDLSMDQIFSEYEQTLFTRAVSVAESVGRKISLLVVPARDIWTAIAQTANNLESTAVVAGLSSKMAPPEQAFNMGRAWEAMPEPKRQFIFQVVRPDEHVETFTIGPHAPSLKTEDIHLTHRLWLNLTRIPGLEKLHHSDIVSLALTRFARDYAGRDHDDIVRDLVKGGQEKRFGLPTPPAPQAEPPKPEKKGKEPPLTGP
jgi:hypothetical protein